MCNLIPLLLQPGQLVLNKYEVNRLLGAGSFGQVFHVFNRNLQQVTALKVIVVDNPDEHRAVVEAHAMSLCGHDHVVRIITADVFDNYVLIEMEYIDGGSLGDRMLREFVPVADSVSYAKHILFALEHAHGRGFLHRDVKPGNIMLAPRVAKLSDFGTAMHYSGISATGRFYQPHASPEAVNDNSFSPLSDVFAAGMTLQRAANNTPGWDHVRKDEISFRQDILDGRLPMRLGHEEWVPRALKTILNRACATDPSKRYQSASAFRQALERLPLARSWKRISPDEWSCEYNGRLETIRFLSKRGYAIEYMIGARRKLDHCRTFATEREARLGLERAVAALTTARK